MAVPFDPCWLVSVAGQKPTVTPLLSRQERHLLVVFRREGVRLGGGPPEPT